MSVTTFKPELWTSMILASLRNKSVVEFFVNHNYEGEIRGRGTSVHINIMNDITVSDYTPGSEITYSDLETVDRELVIDKMKYCGNKLEDVDKIQAAGDLLGAATENMGISLKDNYDKDVFKTMTDSAIAKSNNMVGTDSAPIDISGTNYNNAVDAFIDTLIIADKNNIPTDGRVAAVSPAVAGAIMKSDKRSLTPAFAGFVSTGYIGNLYGTEIFKTNNLAKSSSGNDLIIVTNPIVTTVANQLLNMEAMRAEKYFADYVRALHVYGSKVLYENGVVGAYIKTKAAG